MMEDKNIDYKSLKKAIGKKANLKELAETCVCFANAQGGDIVLGIEDLDREPPKGQKVKQEDLNKVVSTLRSLTEAVAIVNPEIITHDNGGQYFVLKVLPTTRQIATTTSGKVFIRISDNCFPISGPELTDLAAEKTAFQWEIVTALRIHIRDVDPMTIQSFTKDIRMSDKVSGFIKAKNDIEILEYYQLLDDNGNLTNLGVLWLGKPNQRARLSYPVTVQYIVYNEKEEKVRKHEWHFHVHNPKELLLDIEREAIELNYSTEIPDGLYRKNIRQYPKQVIRELLINAIAHKKYTISGDIFIEVYHDRLTITSPGGFPLGISSKNILHQKSRRNQHLIKTLSDLKLMEGEGSGYDLVYETLIKDAKPLPDIESDYAYVKVTIWSGILNLEVISVLDYVTQNISLNQKEVITLGLVALERKIKSTQLATKLQLNQEDRIKPWIGSLLEKNILITQGVRKGTEYLLNPELFAQAKLGLTPSLKTMEPHKLEALILEDVRHNGKSGMTEIKSRLSEIPESDVQKAVYHLVETGDLVTEGAKKNRVYQLSTSVDSKKNK